MIASSSGRVSDARVGEVAEHRKVQVRLTIGEELHLQCLERVAHVVDTRQTALESPPPCDTLPARRARAGRAAAGSARWQQRGHQLIEHRHRDVERRQERQQQQQQQRRARASDSTSSITPSVASSDSSATRPPMKTAFGMAVYSALDRLAERRGIARRSLQLDARRHRSDRSRRVRARLRPVSAVRGRRDAVPDRSPIAPPTLRDARCRFAMRSTTCRYVIARREGHHRVDARRIAAQHGFHHALPLDEHAASRAARCHAGW